MKNCTGANDFWVLTLLLAKLSVVNIQVVASFFFFSRRWLFRFHSYHFNKVSELTFSSGKGLQYLEQVAFWKKGVPKSVGCVISMCKCIFNQHVISTVAIYIFISTVYIQYLWRWNFFQDELNSVLSHFQVVAPGCEHKLGCHSKLFTTFRFQLDLFEFLLFVISVTFKSWTVNISRFSKKFERIQIE